MRVKDFRVLVAELNSLTPAQRRAMTAAAVMALIKAEIANPDRVGRRLRSLAINQARLGLDLVGKSMPNYWAIVQRSRTPA
jgi:hypothetical protein